MTWAARRKMNDNKKKRKRVLAADVAQCLLSMESPGFSPSYSRDVLMAVYMNYCAALVSVAVKCTGSYS